MIVITKYNGLKSL